MPYINLTVPAKETVDEDSLYADEMILDAGGADVFVAGEYEMSISFDGLNRADIALAVLDGDFEAFLGEAAEFAGYDTMSADSLEKTAYIYLKAAQIKRGGDK